LPTLTFFDDELTKLKEIIESICQKYVYSLTIDDASLNTQNIAKAQQKRISSSSQIEHMFNDLSKQANVQLHQQEQEQQPQQKIHYDYRH
jgi:hypothetical protein